MAGISTPALPSTGGGGGGGVVTQGTVPWIIEGDVDTGLDQPLTDIQLRATPVPVSGTITFSNTTIAVTQSTSPWVVSATNLDIRDLAAATDSVTIHGDVGVVDQFDLANSNPAAVAIVDSNGDQISSFGGGTQYEDGDIEPDPIGTVAMGKNADTDELTALLIDSDGRLVTNVGNFAVGQFGDSDNIAANLTSALTFAELFVYDGSTWDRLRGSAADGALVNLGANNDVTVTGSVTANAGTNLNTSALLTTTDFNNSFGTAGSADTQVRSIQGIASMTPVQISDGGNIITVDGTVAVTQSTSPWIVAGGGTAGSAATGVATIQGIASMTPVQVSQATGTNLHAVIDTGSTTAVTQATGTNLHMVVDSGTVTTVSTVTAVTAITNALPAGTNLLGGVNLVPATTGGLTTMNATSSDGGTALTNSAQVIKATAGQLFGYYIYNPNATAQFVQFYNTAAASVTVGTTNPLFMLTIPAVSAANLMGETGITFSNTGWSWAATATAGGNGAPSSSLDAVCFYK